MDKNNTRNNLVRQMFADTGKTYDVVVKITTLWQDSRWKKRILELTDSCDHPETILDLACGTGILTCALAEKFPTSTVVGIDLQEEYLGYARAKKARNAIKNVEFHKKDAEDVRKGKYDLITASYLPKYVDLDVVIGNCSEMMNPGGLVVFHDFVYPEHILLQGGFHVYWLLLKVIFWGSTWRKMSKKLKGIIVETKWVDEIQKALKKYGFTDIHVEVQNLQVAAIVYASKSEPP